MIIVIVIVLLVIGLIKLYIDYTASQYIESHIDNQKYLVRNNHSDRLVAQETADTLATINFHIRRLVDSLLSDQDQPHWVQYLHKQYNSAAISEAAIDTQYTTYTINKEHIHICLRSRDARQQLYEINDLLYVVIHELAHMANYDTDGEPIIGHGHEFQSIFKYLLRQAMKIGVYNYHNYSKYPKDYCGITITSNILD
jgi:hypothetical protein